MKTVISPGYLQGAVKAVPAKAYAHRILISAALCDAPTKIDNLFPSEDILATKTCLSALGAVFTDEDNGCTVLPVCRNSLNKEPAQLDCAESGSTLRFLLPVTAAIGKNAVFTGRGRLSERPLTPLLNVLRQASITVTGDSLPIQITGQLTGEKFITDGSLSSQYVTGMLLALAAMGGKRRLEVTGNKVSGSYIEMTEEILRAFGTEIAEDSVGYTVNGRLTSPKCISVEGDWSNAAFFLAAGVLGKSPVAVTNLTYPSLQGDSVFVDFLRKLGGRVKCAEGKVTAYPSVLIGSVFDCTDCPDLIPILAVTAAHAKGKTVINGVDRLRLKECDRLNAVTELLYSSGTECFYNNDALTVIGGTEKKPFFAKGYADHRIIMSAAILGLTCGCVIDDSAGVKKSYPHFFDDFSQLGGKYAHSV